MSEDKEVKQWKEKLFYRPKNGYDQIDAEQTGEIFAYAEGYKRFLDAARTEREAVKEAIRMAEDAGFVPYTFGMELQPGAKVYVNNRGKALMLAVLGAPAARSRLRDRGRARRFPAPRSQADADV